MSKQDITCQLRASAHPGHTKGIEPLSFMSCSKTGNCEFRVYIGLFFDGTGHRQDWLLNPAGALR